MRKKRIIIILYAVVVILAIVGELTGTTALLFLGFILNILFIVLLLHVYRFFCTQKMYKDIVDKRRYIRGIEKRKYKMFFYVRGKQAEEMENEYDDSIASSTKIVKICIDYLDVEKKYLFKRQRAVLETAKNEIRETGEI